MLTLVPCLSLPAPHKLGESSDRVVMHFQGPLLPGATERSEAVARQMGTCVRRAAILLLLMARATSCELAERGCPALRTRASPLPAPFRGEAASKRPCGLPLGLTGVVGAFSASANGEV